MVFLAEWFMSTSETKINYMDLLQNLILVKIAVQHKIANILTK
jgi:hypothetical protein